MSTEREMRGVSARIETLVEELETLSDPAVRGRVEELVRLLLQLHGEGLTRMLKVLQDQHPDPSPAVERFATDPVIATLLMLHDLHPHHLEARITSALDVLRPALGSQARLTMLGVSDGVVRVEVDVARGACGTSVEAIAAAVTAAVWNAAPDARDVKVETVGHQPGSPLIQLTRREVTQ
jgi:hypothetical protein